MEKTNQIVTSFTSKENAIAFKESYLTLNKVFNSASVLDKGQAESFIKSLNLINEFGTYNLANVLGKIQSNKWYQPYKNIVDYYKSEIANKGGKDLSKASIYVYLAYVPYLKNDSDTTIFAKEKDGKIIDIKPSVLRLIIDNIKERNVKLKQEKITDFILQNNAIELSIDDCRKLLDKYNGKDITDQVNITPTQGENASENATENASENASEKTTENATEKDTLKITKSKAYKQACEFAYGIIKEYCNLFGVGDAHLISLDYNDILTKVIDKRKENENAQ